jgi:hypothetical protein
MALNRWPQFVSVLAAATMMMSSVPSFACMPGGFHFQIGSARLDPRERFVIDDIVGEFRSRRNVRVRLTATTDGIGSVVANRRLAWRRGEAVKTALVRRGIPARMIDIVTETSPPGADPERRQVYPEVVDASPGNGSIQTSTC